MEDYDFNKEAIEERRKFFKGNSLEHENEYSKNVIMVRAALKQSNVFNNMDYVYILKNSLINDLMIKKSIISFNENKDKRLNSSNENTIIGAISHAITMTLTRGEDYHIIIALVDKKDVYKSRNTGEFHYDGKEAIKGLSVININSETIEVSESEDINEIKKIIKNNISLK